MTDIWSHLGVISDEEAPSKRPRGEEPPKHDNLPDMRESHFHKNAFGRRGTQIGTGGGRPPRGGGAGVGGVDPPRGGGPLQGTGEPSPRRWR